MNERHALLFSQKAVNIKAACLNSFHKEVDSP